MADDLRFATLRTLLSTRSIVDRAYDEVAASEELIVGTIFAADRSREAIRKSDLLINRYAHLPFNCQQQEPHSRR